VIWTNNRRFSNHADNASDQSSNTFLVPAWILTNLCTWFGLLILVVIKVKCFKVTRARSLPRDSVLTLANSSLAERTLPSNWWTWAQGCRCTASEWTGPSGELWQQTVLVTVTHNRPISLRSLYLTWFVLIITRQNSIGPKFSVLNNVNLLKRGRLKRFYCKSFMRAATILSQVNVDFSLSMLNNGL
jgi:hypothetical protein